MRNPPSLSVRLLYKEKMATPEKKVFCVLRLRSINQLFLFSGPSGDNFRVICHQQFRTTEGAFVKGKVLDVRVCQKKVRKE
jgi:hypothetical protein